MEVSYTRRVGTYYDRGGKPIMMRGKPYIVGIFHPDLCKNKHFEPGVAHIMGGQLSKRGIFLSESLRYTTIPFMTVETLPP